MLTVGRQHDQEAVAAGRPRPKRPEVVLASAVTGSGVPELLAALDRRRATAKADAARSAVQRAEAQIGGILAERVWARLRSEPARNSTESAIRAVADHEVDPYAAVDQLLADLSGSDRA
jgi:LAO/AO transport system kinase